MRDDERPVAIVVLGTLAAVALTLTSLAAGADGGTSGTRHHLATTVTADDAGGAPSDQVLALRVSADLADSAVAPAARQPTVAEIERGTRTAGASAAPEPASDALLLRALRVPSGPTP